MPVILKWLLKLLETQFITANTSLYADISSDRMQLILVIYILSGSWNASFTVYVPI